ncbi:MAG: type II secretion system F family protein [Rhodospirillaceae bacterium]|nr:type II secretion system F family protein [Rhodospirillaceae bacterium]
MDQTIVMLSVIIGLAIVLLGVVATVIITVARPRMKIKKRIDAIGSLSTGGGLTSKAEMRRQKRIQEKVKSVGSEKKQESISDKISNALLQAGINMKVGMFVFICIAIGAVGVMGFLISGIASPLIAPVFGIVIGIGLPKMFLKIMSNRRQKDFTKHFAEAIDVIVRGIRSGLPVGETLAIISREFTGPLGEEFTMIVEGQRLGMTIDEILDRALKRLPTAEFKFFAIVLQIQRQTGGNLAETLENLSEVLRDRKRLKDKIQALSSEAKSSAMIIASLPFLVLLMLSVVNPGYVYVLFTDGIHLVFIALGIMALGVAVMWKMINFEV